MTNIRDCPSCSGFAGPERCPDCAEITKVGYHKSHIQKGELGEVSKIQEELDELKDAEEQGISVMSVLELADLYGAIEAFIEKHYNNFSMMDLAKMNEATKRAFKNGDRK